MKNYYQSKLAQEMITVSLSDKLKSDHISVNAIKVPSVKVDHSRLPKMSWFKLKIYKMKANFALDPSQIGKVYFWLGDSEDAKLLNGKIINEKCKEVKYAAAVYKENNRKKLFEISDRQTKQI